MRKQQESNDKLITPEEILKIAHYSTTETMKRALEIYKASAAAYTGGSDPIWNFYRSLSNIYEAGRIQGIREQRARQRA